MKVQSSEDVESKPVEMEGAAGCCMRLLISSEQGAPNFAMRLFEIEPGGHTPRHAHPYEHEIFILEGQGMVVEGDQQHPLKAGDVVFVQPNEVHQFRSHEKTPLKLLCLVPNSSAGQKVTLAPDCRG